MIHRFKTVFVLGGPGSGKGAQSELIEKTFKFIHLSAGHLLREEQSRPTSQYGSIIQKIILDGKIVPSHITISLLEAAMKKKEDQSRHFVIDGFPRNLENFTSWKQKTKDIAQCPFVLHFKCSQEQMTRRLLKRGQSSNRSDDNLQVIRKRFKTYYTQTQEVLKEFAKDTKVYHINADPSVEEIFNNVKPIFEELLKKETL